MIKTLITNEPEFIIIIILIFLCFYFKKIKICIFFIIILIFLGFFYRIPSYSFSKKNNNIVSPCTGKIIKIEKTPTHNKLYIFLSVFDPHIQISPVSGKIVQYEYIDGKYQLAYKVEKDNYRSRFITRIQSKYGIVEIIQNTGLVARRIKNFYKLNQNIKKGDILGIIKFGSRVDISIPKKFKLKYKLHDTVSLGNILASY